MSNTKIKQFNDTSTEKIQIKLSITASNVLTLSSHNCSSVLIYIVFVCLLAFCTAALRLPRTEFPAESERLSSPSSFIKCSMLLEKSGHFHGMLFEGCNCCLSWAGDDGEGGREIVENEPIHTKRDSKRSRDFGRKMLSFSLR